MNAKEKRALCKMADELREFGKTKGMTLFGFDHIGSMYEPSPSASFFDADMPNRTVTLPFWLMERMGLVLTTRKDLVR